MDDHTEACRQLCFHTFELDSRKYGYHSIRECPVGGVDAATCTTFVLDEAGAILRPRRRHTRDEILTIRDERFRKRRDA